MICQTGKEEIPAKMQMGLEEIQLDVYKRQPGSDWPMQDEVIAKVNEKLQADGVNIEVKLQRIPWDAWDQKKMCIRDRA